MEATRRGSAKELEDLDLKESHRSEWPRPERWAPLLIAVVAFAAWEWQARIGGISSLFFPAPSVIARTLVRLFADGEMITNAQATLSRLFLGLAVGGMPGLMLGLSMGWSRRVRAVVDPFIAAVHPVPKIAILPLVMIIFGIGETSKIIMVAIAAFFPMVINAMAGVRQINPLHFEVAENYGAGALKTFTRVVVPGSLPSVLAGARLGLNLALLITIAVELAAAKEGLGAMIWLAWETLRTEQLYAGLTVIAVLGITFNLTLQFLAKRLVPWQAERET
jgi:NitT/TauT family transport system permease protein